MIRHTVMFRFADHNDAVDAKERLDALAELVPSVAALWTGLSLGANTDTHDLVLVTDHENQQALNAYQIDPAHRAVGEWIAPRLSDKTTVDAKL